MLCQNNGGGGCTAQDDTEDRKVREGTFPSSFWEKVAAIPPIFLELTSVWTLSRTYNSSADANYLF